MSHPSLASNKGRGLVAIPEGPGMCGCVMGSNPSTVVVMVTLLGSS